MDELKKVIDIVGGQAELARRLGVSRQLITHWLNGRSIPADRAALMEKIVDGRVSARVLAPNFPWPDVAA
ncbi:MAG TPA: Cro/CI family transcriptional regulator [Paraburkholderia sp.]|nr:Cro/CI family transcriptional regulator [Paraburkholderia sp.]